MTDAPDTVESLLAVLANANDLLSARHPDAFQAFEELIRRSKIFNKTGIPAMAHYGAARACLILHQRTKAMDHLRCAFECEVPHVEAGLRLADMLLAENMYEAALTVYEKLLHLTPDLAEARYGYGITMWQLGVASKARVALEGALHVNPDFPAAIVASAFLSHEPPARTGHKASKSVILLIPVSPFVRDWLGGQRYVANLVRTIAMLPPKSRPRVILWLLIDEWRSVPALVELVETLSAYDHVLAIVDRSCRFITRSPLITRYVAWCRVKGTSTSEAVDFLLAKVTAAFPIMYPCWGVSISRFSPLFWIPDVQHEFFPDNFSLIELESRRNDFRALANRDVAVIFSSENARSHFIESQKAIRCRTYVWHFRSPIDSNDDSQTGGPFASLELPPRFYCTPNQILPNKDHATLLRALRRVLDSGVDCQVVCTGAALDGNGPTRQLLRSLITELALQNNVTFLGTLPRSVQIEVMRRSAAIIQPSLFEGWSTVVEDARALGRPLIVSDIAIHREQLGEEATFFEPGNDEFFAAAIVANGLLHTPGPDLEKEAAARIWGEERATEAMYEFLEIVRKELNAAGGVA